MWNFINPVVSSILQWAAIGMLGAVLAGGKKIYSLIVQTTMACKRLTRTDLVNRYKFCRDHGGWMSDDRKRTWLDDYESYMEMVGRNGYIEEIREKVVAMPNEPKWLDNHCE